MDRFSELRAFTSVVEEGGFSAAARQLGQSRSAINRLVIALEERLGVQLLHRTTRSVAPNSNGAALYERARQLLDDLDEIEGAVSSTQSNPTGTLRISAPHSFGDLNFKQAIARFAAKHPTVLVDVTFESRLVDPVAEGFDLVIRVAEPDETTMLVDHRILKLDYLLCASPAYIAANGMPEHPGDLERHASLYHRHTSRKPSWALTGPTGLIVTPLRPVMFANTLDMLLTAACQGLGIALLPRYAVQSDLEANRLQIVLENYVPPHRMLQVIYPPARHLSAKVRLFTDFLEAWCAPGKA